MREVLYKIFGKYYTSAAVLYNQVVTIIKSYLVPYEYRSNRYLDTFLSMQSANSSKIKDTALDKIIYIFWTGNNEITPNRKKAIASIERNSGVEVKLITPQNLNEYIKEEDPLPDAFQYLSLNHKSDYLRSYFMHHYGGGYADIKMYGKSWVSAFEQLEKSDAYAIGYREVGFLGAASQTISNAKLKDDLRTYWRLLIGNGAFVCKPHTPLTAEWHAEAKRRLLYYSDYLKEHPAKDFFGSNDDYPIPWPDMQGAIFHPLCLKYHDKLLVDNALKPSFKNYR